ncbi:MAG: hypothetical protein QOE33_3420 [Acidobacteriota bacterium]|nr:hypothetical protein [Acidobacteriota bacterium]
MRKFLCPIILLISLAAAASAQNVSVADVMKISSTAGEAQSTVVPPGKKSQCNEGRFLVTDDGLRPPKSVVSGRDLDKSGGAAIQSTFDMSGLGANFNTDASKSNYYFGTNDHDLVTLSNGDVLYITGAFTRMPMSPISRRIDLPQNGKNLAPSEPAWLKDTYRAGVCNRNPMSGECTSYDFGPNTRSTVLVFRSTDCGENFTYVSEMDPLHFGGGTCALPQFRRNPDNSPITSKPWDMGGTDGQLIKVDPANDRIYLAFQCVGYNPSTRQGPEFVLNPNDKINKTLVMLSDTAGSSWKTLGYIGQAQWRFGVVPLSGDELTFGFASSVLTAIKNPATGKYTFDSTGVAAPTGQFNWMGWWDFKGTGVPLTKNNGNVFGIPILARAPGSKSVVLAFPDTFGASGYGYRVFFYDRANKTLAEGPPIMPAAGGASSIAFHLTAADSGTGPILLYWTDLNSATKKITVRGRLLTGVGESSEDFTVSRASGADYSFALTSSKWFGDYHTASALVRKTGHVEGQGKFTVDMRTTRFDFYPMWVEPDNDVHYTRVEYAVDSGLLTTVGPVKPKPVKLIMLPPNSWKPQPSPVELTQIKRPEREMTSEPNVQRVPSHPGNIRRIP